MIESAAQRVVDQSVMGALLVLSLCAVVFLFNLYVKQRDKYEALLLDTIQRDDKHFDTMKETLNFVKDVSKQS